MSTTHNTSNTASAGGKTPLSRAMPGLAFSLASTLAGVVSLFLPMYEFDEEYAMSDEVSSMTLLKALGHSEFRTVGLLISIAAIFVVLGFSLAPFITGGKLTSIQIAGRTGVTAGGVFVVGRIADFIKMKRDNFPFDQLGMGFILFSVAGVLMFIAGFVVRNTANRIEAESKPSDFDVAAASGQAPAGQGQQGFPQQQGQQGSPQTGQQLYQEGQQSNQGGQQPLPHQ